MNQVEPSDVAQEPPLQTPPPATARKGPHPSRNDHRTMLVAGACFIVLLVAAAYFLVPQLFVKDTDDAYVDAHVVSVISKLPAYVQALHIDDNTRVAAGELLVELDPRDYAVQLQQAQAGLASAQSQLEDARNQIPVADAEIARQRAELQVVEANAGLATINLRRLESVSDIRAVSSQRVDEGKAAQSSTQASVLAAQVRIKAAQAQAALVRSQVQTAQTKVDEARALLAQAQLNLAYTKIFATEAGTVARKSVETGNYVQPGQLLLSIVPNKLYVIANYKETQLTRARPGDAATIHVDAFPGMRLHGHIDSIQRGTGSRFALLPPENATGNFVKVVQRVPVKIVLDDPPDTLRWISPGMSVEARIVVRDTPAWLSFLH